MKVIDPSFTIYPHGNPEDIMKHIEQCARVCYQSEGSATKDSYDSFIRRLIRKEHEAMLEHGVLTVKFRLDRGLSHELVRHRIASFAQESTRYCSYRGKDIEYIKPTWFSWEEAQQLHDHMDDYRANPSKDPFMTAIRLWYDTTSIAASNYQDMLAHCGRSPQEARGILPHALATTLVVTANLREWRKIFTLRCESDAHPDMKDLMRKLLAELVPQFPCVFEDIARDMGMYQGADDVLAA